MRSGLTFYLASSHWTLQSMRARILRMKDLVEKAVVVFRPTAEYRAPHIVPYGVQALLRRSRPSLKFAQRDAACCNLDRGLHC